MTTPRLLARVEVTNGQGTYDSRNPSPRPGDTLDSVRIEYTVRRTLSPTPNTATVRLYNLADEDVDRITGTVRRVIEFTPEQQAELLAAGASAEPVETVYGNGGQASIRLSWGYAGADPSSPFPPLQVGFVGASDKMRVVSDGRDKVLEIEAQDGGQILGAGRLRKTFRAGADYVQILVELINALGLTVDADRLRTALLSFLNSRNIPIGTLQTLDAYAAGSAPAATQIRSFVDALGLRWSIQNGEFLILDADTVLAGFEPIQLSASRGTLWGNPERLDGGDVKATSWANAELRPGREAFVEATDLSTNFRVEQADDSGDTGPGGGGSTVVTLSALQTIPGVF